MAIQLPQLATFELAIVLIVVILVVILLPLRDLGRL
jgi:hypothetical protein